jgi:hypothetical protein
MDWELKLAAVFLALALCAALACGARASEPTIELSDPVCPSRTWIAQRYDDRNRRGVIVKSVWIRRCYAMPKPTYAPH